MLVQATVLSALALAKSDQTRRWLLFQRVRQEAGEKLHEATFPIDNPVLAVHCADELQYEVDRLPSSVEEILALMILLDNNRRLGRQRLGLFYGLPSSSPPAHAAPC